MTDKLTTYKILPVAFTLFASVMIGACQGGSMLDKKAPFGSKVVRLGDVEVATVDGTAIYLSDVAARARSNGDLAEDKDIDINSPVFQKTLRQLIDQRVLGLAAITQSLDQSETAKRRLATMREQIYGRFVIEDVLVKSVTDEEIKRLYEEQKSLNGQGQERLVRHIVVETGEEAEEALKRLTDGEDFDTLAGILSIDPTTQNNGGNLGWFSRGMLGQSISDTAFSTEIGSLSDIFESNQGFHILEVMASRTTPQKSFEELEPKLREFLTYEAINKTIQTLRYNSDIRQRVAPEQPVAFSGDDVIEGSLDVESVEPNEIVVKE